ncbi:MAG: lipid IV(A) 3-deoxy-D-manno-octulosonic acid transferase [Pseudomonadota bacterium]
MFNALYTLVATLALPFALVRLILRSFNEPGYRDDVRQRLGFFGHISAQPTLWIHAVSAGETRASASLIAALSDRYPAHRILLTQMTATGRQAAIELYGDAVTLCWLPWDLPWAQKRFLRTWKPGCCILMETEIWPNLIRACVADEIPIVLANARLSERSARRYGRVPSFARQIISSIHLVLAQTDADALRFRTLGAVTVRTTGNLKFDVPPPSMQIAEGRRWRAALGKRQTVLLASTRDGEELLLLRALHVVLQPETLILLVPRHPQRFDAVATLVQALGLSLERRSSGRFPERDTQVWLGDTMGEMISWYALADLAVIGGSWLPLGGQNLIEACAAACPVIVGPHTFNFEQVAIDAINAGAAVRAQDPNEAAQQASILLAASERLKTMGEAALAFANAHRGATALTLDMIDALIHDDSGGKR